MNKSWKTTTLGILTIVSAVSSALTELIKAGTLPDLGVLIAAITSGIGLIAARDKNVTSEQQNAK